MKIYIKLFIFFFIIYGISFACNAWGLIYCPNIVDNVWLINDSATALDILPSIVQAIASILSILIVVYIYRESKKEKIYNYQNDTYLYWFRSTILDKNIPKLETYFQNSISTFSKILNENKDINKLNIAEITEIISLAVKSVSAEKLNLFPGFMDYLEILNEPIQIDIEDKLEKYIDSLTQYTKDYLTASTNLDLQGIKTKINELSRTCKQQIISELYSGSMCFDRKLICNCK